MRPLATVALILSLCGCIRSVRPVVMPTWTGQSRDPDPTRIPNEQATSQGRPETSAAVAPTEPAPQESWAALAAGVLVQLLAGGTPSDVPGQKLPLLFGVFGTFEETDPMAPSSGEGKLIDEEEAARTGDGENALSPPRLRFLL